MATSRKVTKVLSTLKLQHHSATHRPGVDSSCPACLSTTPAAEQLRSDGIVKLYDAIGDLLTVGESAVDIAMLTAGFTTEITAQLANEAQTKQRRTRSAATSV